MSSGSTVNHFIKVGSCLFYAAFRMGPDLATSRHDLAQRRLASADFRIVSMWVCFSHSAAQASQTSAQKAQSWCANWEFDDSNLAVRPHTGAHSPQRRMDPAMAEGSFVSPASMQAEHQCRHCKQSSIARSTVGLEAVVTAIAISLLELKV